MSALSLASGAGRRGSGAVPATTAAKERLGDAQARLEALKPNVLVYEPQADGN
jgi:hypothetical protein